VTKKNSDNSDSCKPRRKPTVKQLRFAATYVDPLGANGNGVVAARIAGYRGSARQLAVQAHSNLKNQTVQQTIAEMVDALVVPALQRVGEAMDAVTVRPFLTKSGTIVYAQPQADQKARLEASKLVFELRRACGNAPVAAVSCQQEHGHDRPPEDKCAAPMSAAVSEMDPADRIAFREAGEIEKQLAEVDRELAEGGEDGSEEE
jgi:hypothetical protein